MKKWGSVLASMTVMAMAAWGCGGGGGTGGPGGAGSGGSGGSGSSGSGGGTTGGEKVCPPWTNNSVGSHIVVVVSWPASLAIKAGEGELHVWTKADLTFGGGDVSGTARPCGTLIPPLTKTALVGGGRVQLEIPDAPWEAAGMPTFQIRGSTSGFDAGEAIHVEPIASLIGLTMNDPLQDPWPNEASELTTTDPDGDGQPGLKTLPRTDPPFSAPPLDLAGVLDPNGARADEIYLATRTIMALTGTRDSCASVEGTAEVSSVDSHVVGCHVRGGDTCTSSQASFVDATQPRFIVKSAKFKMIDVAPDATCTEVRAALPPS